MSGEYLAENMFEGSGVKVRTAPERVTARCYRKERSAISFNPADPDSVQRAKKEARSQSVTVYHHLCQNCSVPDCIFRLLDDDNEANLLLTFGQGI